MNGVDYNKQINKDREYMRDALEKNRKATNKELEIQEKRHETILDKRTKNHTEDKAELQSKYSKNTDEMREKTKDAIDYKSKMFNDALDKQREQFETTSQNKSKDFDQRLSDIKNSYQKSFKDNKENNELMAENKHKVYKRNIQDMSQSTDKKIQEYHEKVTGSGNSLKEDYMKEQQQQLRAHEDQIRNIYKSESAQKTDIKDRLQDNLKKTKDVHAAEMEHTEQHNRNRIKQVREHSDQKVQSMVDDFSIRNENMVDAQKVENTRNNQLVAMQFQNAQRDYSKQLRSVELEHKLRQDGGPASAASEKQSGFDANSVSENRLKALRGELNKVSNTYSERWAKDQDVFKEQLRTESFEASGRMATREKQLKGEKLVTMANERERAHKSVTSLENQNLVEKETNSRLMATEKSAARERVDKLKESFNTSLKTLEEKHRGNLESVASMNKTEKAEHIKRMTDERNNTIFEMKNDFAKVMDSTVSEYEARLANYKKDNEQIRSHLEDKIHSLKFESDSKIEAHLKTFEERRIADQKSNRLLIEQKENALKSQITQLNMTNQRKIDQMSTLSDRKLKTVTQDYESKLKILAASKATELNTKDLSHAAEIEKLKTSHADEKMRISSQYESKIASIRNGYEDQLEQINQYKKLS